MLKSLPQKSYQALIAAIRHELREGLGKAEAAVQKQRVITYWHIGQHIHGFLDGFSGPDITYLAPIAEEFDFEPNVVRKMLKFYRAFPRLPNPPPLSWTKYRALSSAPASSRSALLKKAIAQDTSADELYALINAGRQGRRPSTAEKKLEYARGQLFVYKTLQGKHLKLKKGQIMVDCGFKWLHKARIRTDSSLTGGCMVRSVKTEKGYTLQYCRKKELSWLYTYTARVQRVVDADTLLLTVDAGFDNWHDARVRLRGIDAPEMSTSAGLRAYQYVKKALGDRPVVIKSYKEGKYGRYLVDVFYCKNRVADPQTIADEGIFLNQELLNRGLAKPYKG